MGGAGCARAARLVGGRSDGLLQLRVSRGRRVRAAAVGGLRAVRAAALRALRALLRAARARARPVRAVLPLRLPRAPCTPH